jgi:hypothetical protein
VPNLLDSTGLQTKTRQELIDYFTAAYKAIYGNDINLESSTPDGQMIAIFVQAILDNSDLLTQVYNGFDPDLAIGRVLDQRVALNGLQRQAGTHTITNVSITVDRALNLVGLDDYELDPSLNLFVVKDNAGTEYSLIESVSFSVAGTAALAFQASDPGATLTVPNTITLPVTIVAGVTAINNPTTYTTLGINEETDAQLRIRRQRSVSISSQGYLAGLLAELLNIAGITDAFVYENVTGSTDGDGIPGHSIWVIVSQGGADVDIANSIYRKRNAGCGMKGSVTHIITQADGSEFIVRWDVVDPEDLYIEFDAHSMNGVDAIDTAYIKTQLVERLHFGVYDRADINEIATMVREIDSNCLVTGAGVALSGGGPFYGDLLPSAKNRQFTLDAANISITVV